MAGMMRAVAAILVLLVLQARPARAEVTAAEAATLSDTLRAWATGLAGPLAEPARLPWTITPDGERFRMALGLASPAGLVLDASGPTTLALAPRPDGTWAVEDLRWPGQIHIATAVGKPLLALAAASQQASGEIDPTMARPSRIDGSITDLVETAGAGRQQVSTRIHTSSYRTAWRPAPAGGLDLAITTHAQGYTQLQTLADHTELKIEVGAAAGKVTAQGVSPAAVALLLRHAIALGTPIPASARGDHPVPPRPGPRAAARMIEAGGGNLFARFDATQSGSAISIATGGLGISLAQARLSVSAAAPAGDAVIRFRLEADGLDTNLVAPGPLHDLLPRHLVVAPRVSGVPESALLGLLANVPDTPGPATATAGAAFLGLIANHPMTIALDGLELDAGPAHLTGTGDLQIAGADQIVGSVTLRMRGLDALIQAAGKVAEARPAVPFLMMLKGMGEAGASGETVWRVSYAAGRITVNGSDLTDLMRR